MPHGSIITTTLLAMSPHKDNVITVHREFVQFTGSLEAGMMLSQILYWTERASRSDRSFYKSDKEWCEELCLTRYGVRAATKTLKDMGIIAVELHKANAAPTNHFSLNADALASAWQEYLISKNGLSEIKQSDCPKSNNRLSEIVQTLTETTTEITTETLFPASVEAHNTPEKKERKKRKTTLPIDFSITPEMRQWATEHAPNVNLETATAKFKDDAIKNDKRFADWVAAWRNWMRNAQEWGTDKKQNTPQQQRIDHTAAANDHQITPNRTQMIWLATIKRDADEQLWQEINRAQQRRWLTTSEYQRFTALGMPGA